MILACLLTPTFAVRTSVDADGQTDGPLVICEAEGEPGPAGGMTVKWGVPKNKCMALCSPTHGDGFTYEQEFARAFKVSLGSGGSCECSADGKLKLRFKPRNLDQAKECKAGESPAVHKECWDMYVKARGTYFEKELQNPRYKVPFSSTNFVVHRKCGDNCTGDECPSVSLPGMLHGMSGDDKKNVGKAIKKVMDGEKVDRDLKELIEHLPPSDLDDSEFKAIDIDDDGHLDMPELIDYYKKFTPKQLEGFVKEADDDKNGTIERKEFDKFKEAMRKFNPKVDLITGDKEFIIDDDGEVTEPPPVWEVTGVTCKKFGKKVDDAECARTEAMDDAMLRFDQGAEC